MRTEGRIAKSNSLLFVMFVVSFANGFAIGQTTVALPEESGSPAAQWTWDYGFTLRLGGGGMHYFGGSGAVIQSSLPVGGSAAVLVAGFSRACCASPSSLE